MSAQNKKDQINLLPQKGFSSTTSGRVLVWLLSTFRVIVIVTEILVMVAFLSRFWLDAQNSDLNDELQRKKDILEASKDFENNFRNVQKKIEVFAAYSEQKDFNSSTLQKVTLYLPPEIFLDSAVIESGKMTIMGLSPNERNIQQLIVNLQSDERFQEVLLTSLATQLDNPELLEFQMEAKITK